MKKIIGFVKDLYPFKTVEQMAEEHEDDSVNRFFVRCFIQGVLEGAMLCSLIIVIAERIVNFFNKK